MENLSREVVIPFSGFYCSWWEDALDREAGDCAEYDSEREEPIFPADMPAGERAEILHRRTDYRAAMLEIAREYVGAWRAAFEDTTGHKIRADFVALDSPRFYNFTTDRIFARVPLADLARIRAAIGEDALEAHAREVFRPRDGFAPFSEYLEGDITQWPADLAAWDHNQLACIIGAALAAAGEDAERDCEMSAFEDMTGNGDICRAWESAVDWDAVARDCTEWLETQTEEAAQ